MPRPNRVDFPGARHHVMNRGARKEPIFRDETDVASFMACTRDACHRFGLRVHGFALMPNHFHLMVQSEQGRLSDGMSYLQGRYSRTANLRGAWDGPIWRGRFKSRLVEDEDYWAHLLAYLHLNPVRAHLAPSPSDAHWTSHAYYVGELSPPDWLETSELLDLLGGPTGVAEYVHAVQIKSVGEPPGFDSSQLFRVPKSQPRVPDRKERLRIRTPDEAIAEVCMVTGLERQELFTCSRGRPGNRAAWLAVWWLQRAAGARQVEVARLMGLAQPGVAQRIQHFQRAIGNGDPELVRWRSALLERA